MKTKKVKCNVEYAYGIRHGKIYDVIEENWIGFKIINDNNKTVWWRKDYFWKVKKH